MTTTLEKAVRRQTTGRHRGRQMVVTLYPGDVLGLRQARTRTEYTVSLAACYDIAVKLEVIRKKAEKAAKRKAQKGSK